VLQVRRFESVNWILRLMLNLIPIYIYIYIYNAKIQSFDSCSMKISVWLKKHRIQFFDFKMNNIVYTNAKSSDHFLPLLHSTILCDGNSRDSVCRLYQQNWTLSLKNVPQAIHQLHEHSSYRNFNLGSFILIWISASTSGNSCT
jgi:hypothetical protein